MLALWLFLFDLLAFRLTAKDVMTESPRLVWLPMDHRLWGDALHQKPCLMVGEKYARAVPTASEAQPMLFPLAACAGAESVWVNSLHTQGIHELAPGLRTLAVAPDGLVEVFEIADARAFTSGVQRHPQWQCGETPFYRAIFRRFGGACRARQRVRLASLQS